ncbi:MAG: flagellin, partial [Athalassotoga sp.]|uniref:flagellin n=1 Tax=Athalassotoga sp. TaxID=2022597 RepID=UPI003CFBF852
GAQAAISIIDNANQVVSTEAAKLGALQNRITDITNNLQTSSTNLTSAEATIKDADMAKELMTYSKQQILLQSSMAMLGQANANPQQILRLFTNLP